MKTVVNGYEREGGLYEEHVCEKIMRRRGRGCVTARGPVGRGEALRSVPSCATLVGP